MRFVITGGTGFIGREVVRHLVADDSLPGAPHQLIGLTRDAERAATQFAEGVEWRTWNPRSADLDPRPFDGADAVIHLAGETAVGRRLDAETKREVRRSRIDSTSQIVDALGRVTRRPTTFVCASAVGYYGSRPSEEELTESSSAGADFLASVCRDWEKAAAAASDHGVRVVHARFGIVLGPGGALEAMARPIKWFVGGKLGHGHQVVSWVDRRDVARALVFLMGRPDLDGPFNITAPQSLTNEQLTKVIGRVLGRPTPFTVPKFALRAALGEGAEPILGGQRAVPRRLLDAGFRFQSNDPERSVREALT